MNTLFLVLYEQISNMAQPFTSTKCEIRLQQTRFCIQWSWCLIVRQAASKISVFAKNIFECTKKIDQSEGFHFLYNSCKSCLFSKKSKIVIELRKNCTILEILLSNVAFVIAIAKLPYFFWLGQSCIFIMSYQMEWKRKIL